MVTILSSEPAITNLRIKNIYKILFICFVTIGLYYPSIFSQFNSIDDIALINYLEETDFNLFDLIIPGHSHYYRPVIWFTFFFDKYVWGLEPSFMHFGNILIHLFNSVLVYCIVKNICCSEESRLELPLLSALLFTAHPITTEAVCWVAGRTDPLATSFVLLATYSISSLKNKISILNLILPACFIFLGSLTKEVAFFFFPPAFLYAARQISLNVKNRYPLQNYVHAVIPFLSFALFYLYLRKIALQAEDRSVSLVLTHNSSFVDTITGSLKALGFYVKKLALPLPLNFAITSYSDYYIYLGILSVVLMLLLLLNKNIYCFYLGSSIFLIIPAVIVAVRPVAWTPVAERYLYAPVSLFVIAFVGILHSLMLKYNKHQYLPVILISICIASSFITVQRNIIWQDNYLLFRDAVTKSPQFARIRNEYGIALNKRGERTAADEEFKIGKTIDHSYILPVLNLANNRLKEGKVEDALKLLADSYKTKKEAETNVLKFEARIYESLLFKTTNNVEKMTLMKELVENYEYIYSRDKDPYILYRRGQLYLFAGEQKKAASDFQKAYETAPDGTYFKLPAKKLADKFNHFNP